MCNQTPTDCPKCNRQLDNDGYCSRCEIYVHADGSYDYAEELDNEPLWYVLIDGNIVGEFDTVAEANAYANKWEAKASLLGSDIEIVNSADAQ